jgi:hypothetical protein
MRLYTAVMKPLLALFASAALAATAVAQQDGCAAFKWNVSHERELFAGHATAATTGATQVGATLLSSDRLYELQLNPLAQVQFVVPPGKSKGGSGPYAGLARVHVPTSGTWRIALDEPVWIDVVAAGQAIPSSDYQGRPDCHAPHKIVQFPLPANQELVIQLSGTAQAQVHLTITRGEN